MSYLCRSTNDQREPFIVILVWLMPIWTQPDPGLPGIPRDPPDHSRTLPKVSQSTKSSQKVLETIDDDL